jgi:tRNA modification GTPase
MEDLVDRLIERARALLPREGEVALNRRHRILLEEVTSGLKEALAASDLLIIAEALRRSRAGLDRVTGRAGVEEMLDALFGKLCIGK